MKKQNVNMKTAECSIKKFAIPLVCAVFAALVVACGPEVEGVQSCGLFGQSRKVFVLGQDGVSPVEFDQQTTMWTFGDTILGSWKGEVSAASTFSERTVVRGMICNSLAFTPRISAANITALPFVFHTEKGAVAQFIRHARGENPLRIRLWAMDGIRLGDAVYVYYTFIRILDPKKVMDMRVEATGIARWDVPAGWKPGGRVEFKRLAHVFNGVPVAFGACVMRKDGYLYTVGQYAGKDSTLPVKIARVREESIESGKEYEFLASDGSWTGAMDGACGFLGDVMGECSLSYNDHLGKYVILYCRQWAGEMVMVTFRDFSELGNAVKRVVYAMPPLPPQKRESMAFYYSAKEVHSEGRDIYSIYINPLEYQPYLVRINLR